MGEVEFPVSKEPGGQEPAPVNVPVGGEPVHDAAQGALGLSPASSPEPVKVKEEVGYSSEELEEYGENIPVEQAVQSVSESLHPATDEIPDKVLNHFFAPIHDRIQQMTPQQLYAKMRTLREEIRETKEWYRQQQAAAHSEEAGSSSSVSFAGDEEMSARVSELMKVGVVTFVEGGKSGVYFLGMEGEVPEFVLKPLDEESFALNNPKGMALPYANSDKVAKPKEGIPLYQSVQNNELTYLIAKMIGCEGATPQTQVMILESERFYDIADIAQEYIEEIGNAKKEKLCTVQRFCPDCQDIGDIVITNADISQEALMGLSNEERNEVLKSAVPDDIDQEMYENCALLSWVIGEKDGNAGGLMVANTVVANNKRSIYKIDNSCTFPEDNSLLMSGLDWEARSVELPLSDRLKTKINNIDTGKIAVLMYSRGKTKEAVEAMEARVGAMQYLLSDDVDKTDKIEQTIIGMDYGINAYMKKYYEF